MPLEAAPSLCQPLWTTAPASTFTMVGTSEVLKGDLGTSSIGIRVWGVASASAPWNLGSTGYGSRQPSR